MINSLLIRYGDLMLKGNNRKRFVKKVIENIEEKVYQEGLVFEKAHDRFYIHIEDENIDYLDVVENLHTVSGLKSYSPVAHSGREIDEMIETAKIMLEKHPEKPQTFKVSVKRADKTYPMNSMDIEKTVSGPLLKAFPHFSVDLSKPEVRLSIEIRRRGVYVYTEKIPGLGGFPAGIQGKGLLMLSGGIDSPVAGFLAMKQGVLLEGIHFESTPLTSLESVQKVLDLTKQLTKYAYKSSITIHIIPFKTLHETLMNHVPEPYHITIMRRMMYRIADRVALKDHMPALINGESIGQVASQTLESIHTANNVTNLPIIRPLITMDKEDITRISERIGCYPISIKPFEDCCTIYTPKKPATAPRVYYAERYESLFDFEPLVQACVDNAVKITITKDSSIDITAYGLEFTQAINSWRDENND